MSGEFTSFKKEVKDEIATLNVGVRNDIASLAKSVASLKEALLRDDLMGEDKGKAPTSHAGPFSVALALSPKLDKLTPLPDNNDPLSIQALSTDDDDLKNVEVIDIVPNDSPSFGEKFCHHLSNLVDCLTRGWHR